MKKLFLLVFGAFLFQGAVLKAQQIHEIDYDQPGTDNGEFIEVRLPSTATLADFRITRYNGSTPYGTAFTLDDATVTCTTAGPVQYCVWDPSGTDNLQNGGADGISLYNIATSTLIELLSYEGTFTATSGDASGTTSTDIGVSETNSTAANMSLQREESGTSWFGPSASTAGGSNEVPVPVELISFKGFYKNSQVSLSWQTASEENNSHFEVEHSTNGRDFQTLDKVNGNGTTAEIQQYNYMHENAATGKNYYRLRQVDFDGAFEYSDVAVVEIKGEGHVQIRPTLVSNTVTLSFSETIREETQVQILDVTGRQVRSLAVGSGTEQMELSVADLEKGLYFVQIGLNSEVTTLKFVKQ